MKENIQIVHSGFNHQEAITDISVKVWQSAYKGIIDQHFLDNISFEERLNGRKKWMSEPGHYSLIANDGEQIFGFCDFGISRRSNYGKGEIYAIYILGEYQKKGIGELLLKKAILELQFNNLVPVIVTTLEKNFSARKFYEKNGFSIIDAIETKVGDKECEEVVYLYHFPNLI